MKAHKLLAYYVLLKNYALIPFASPVVPLYMFLVWLLFLLIIANFALEVFNILKRK